MAWAVRRRAGVCGLLRRSLVVFVSWAAVRRSADLLQRSALPPTVCVTSERERESRGRSPSLESENSRLNNQLLELVNRKRQMCCLFECDGVKRSVEQTSSVLWGGDVCVCRGRVNERVMGGVEEKRIGGGWEEQGG